MFQTSQLIHHFLFPKESMRMSLVPKVVFQAVLVRFLWYQEVVFVFPHPLTQGAFPAPLAVFQAEQPLLVALRVGSALFPRQEAGFPPRYPLSEREVPAPWVRFQAPLVPFLCFLIQRAIRVLG